MTIDGFSEFTTSLIAMYSQYNPGQASSLQGRNCDVSRISLTGRKDVT